MIIRLFFIKEYSHLLNTKMSIMRTDFHLASVLISNLWWDYPKCRCISFLIQSVMFETFCSLLKGVKRVILSQTICWHLNTQAVGYKRSTGWKDLNVRIKQFERKNPILQTTGSHRKAFFYDFTTKISYRVIRILFISFIYVKIFQSRQLHLAAKS